ncbi:MAG: aminopeptidase N, partial [Novosphingobium sp.]|nr:aminopeptidase N [Novosphingobium sp.]
MDIASRPSEPVENEKIADAAPPPQAQPVINREDYRPPNWLVPEVRLSFRLGIDATHLTSKLSVERNPEGGSDTLRLNGDGIAALCVNVDGKAADGWRMDGPDLLIDLSGDSHEVEIETALNPAANSQLMGLYASNGMLCTQCEAEGFRRMTFFPDRPDVLSIYRVRMEGDKESFPILLSNGNCVAQGEGDAGSHWAEWHDPWPKPSYLFALVAGQLVANHSTFTTMNGREVDLNIWVRPGDESRTGHAMDSLKNAMKWDEETFGREYDLDLYNIVAVSDFNMGA